MCVYKCLPEGIRFAGARVIGGCEPSVTVMELDWTESLGEQGALNNSESALLLPGWVLMQLL